MRSKTQKFPAYPLITCDPYFSVWSMCDTLNGDFTRHWTGTQHSMTGIITVDGVSKTFMGRMCHDPEKNICGPTNIEQKNVYVSPLNTIYPFSDEDPFHMFLTMLILWTEKIINAHFI